MREIKFRALVIVNKIQKWIYYTPLEFISKYEGYCDVVIVSDLQYTGISDKYGKYIYDGDVVKTLAGNGFIEWRKGCFHICWNKNAGTTLHDTLPKYMEVIGNIYENPELLTP